MKKIVYLGFKDWNVVALGMMWRKNAQHRKGYFHILKPNIETKKMQNQELPNLGCINKQIVEPNTQRMKKPGHVVDGMKANFPIFFLYFSY